ncbi:MAG: glycerol-3-phosphate dehydrogenase [Litoreibacter sp.]|nr:glycerol-3-phosphate dehydrogenase [Litoreibacter sp.]
MPQQARAPECPPETHDLFIIGGGINGCGIARDAAGRGLSVALAEMGDLAQATSSASTKLFHGGLRYLEYFEFRLVREALIERETLLRAMPHISWPMRFVLPYHRDMRFESDTPTSRLLARIMPWMKGRRPAWLIRFGLFLYDRLGTRTILPGTSDLDLRQDPAGAPLKERFVKAFEYSDCWIEDARLVVLNARDAKQRGARIMTRTKVVSAQGCENHWEITVEDVESGTRAIHRARALVNAAGPWVGDILTNTIGSTNRDRVRLVRGSHIVTRRLYDHDKSYFFQGPDGRIIFAIPYETDFTLIGTTDTDHADAAQVPVCTPEEQRYLLDFASDYFKTPVTDADVIWTYSGVRPLYDDGANSATAATRDYLLKLSEEDGAPLLNIFGGKITTYRKLAEAAMARVTPYFSTCSGEWTAGISLPGGDFPVDGVEQLVCRLLEQYPFLDNRWALRLVRAYGTDTFEVLGDARTTKDLGQEFGASITERELLWGITNEWVCTAEDFVWRRSKLGLRLTQDQIDRIDDFIQETRSAFVEGQGSTENPAVALG